MKKHTLWVSWLLAFGLAVPALPATYDDPASVRDVQRLQQDIENLDEELDALEESDPSKARRMRARAEAVREDVVALRSKMRRHQDDGRAGTGVSQGEVSALRDEVRDLRAAMDEDRSSTRRAGDVSVPADTEISVRLDEPLSSATASIEDRFRAEVQRPVRVDGDVVIPAGAELRGIVRRAEPAQRAQKAGRLELDFDSLYVDGRRVDVRTSVVAMQDEDGDDDIKRKAGIGAILGGVVGGLLKGRTGALIGVLAGGGVVVAQKGQDVELPEGTILRVRLERPVTITR